MTSDKQILSDGQIRFIMRSVELSPIIEMNIETVHMALWARLFKDARDLIYYMNSAYKYATKSQQRWIIKANKLIKWLYLPENRELQRRERKSLPYERSTAEYHNWRIDCLNRDNWECQSDKDEHSRQLHVHHIKAYKDYKELRLIIDNGITLCKDCHEREHKRVKYGL